MTVGRSDVARALAESVLSETGDRVLHVRRVGAVAERLTASLVLGSHVAEAAWLHDIGYGVDVASTGFHPLDGAEWLAARGWSTAVVGLVAYHSGAATEADERGLGQDLQSLPLPAPGDLDVVNFCDLTTSPDGRAVSVEERVTEILNRYPADDPVHRAVLRSRVDLVASVRRVEARLVSADVDLAVVG